MGNCTSYRPKNEYYLGPIVYNSTMLIKLHAYDSYSTGPVKLRQRLSAGRKPYVIHSALNSARLSHSAWWFDVRDEPLHPSKSPEVANLARRGLKCGVNQHGADQLCEPATNPPMEKLVLVCKQLPFPTRTAVYRTAMETGKGGAGVEWRLDAYPYVTVRDVLEAIGEMLQHTPVAMKWVDRVQRQSQRAYQTSRRPGFVRPPDSHQRSVDHWGRVFQRQEYRGGKPFVYALDFLGRDGAYKVVGLTRLESGELNVDIEEKRADDQYFGGKPSKF